MSAVSWYLIGVLTGMVLVVLILVGLGWLTDWIHNLPRLPREDRGHADLVLIAAIAALMVLAGMLIAWPVAESICPIGIRALGNAVVPQVAEHVGRLILAAG